ncbi:MAG: CvpA family protein [Christensenellales bacterium]
MFNYILALPELPIPVSYVTIGAAVILLLGLIIGAKQGLVKALFSILSTAGSIVAATFIMPYVSNFLMGQAKIQEMIATYGTILNKAVAVISFIMGWILAFVVLKIIFAIINKIFSGDGVLGTINRLLGAVFGLAASALVVITIVYLMNLFSSSQSIFQELLDNANTDPVGAFLVENNLLGKLIDLIAEKVPAFADFLASIGYTAAS